MRTFTNATGRKLPDACRSLLTSVLLGCTFIPPLSAVEVERSPEDPSIVWTPNHVVLISQPVAPGVYAVFPDDSADKNTRGVPATTAGGFVIGENGVLGVDTMLNRRLAGQLLALIHAQVNVHSTYQEMISPRP